MGDYIDVKCARCGKTIEEFWREDVEREVVVEIEECYDCGYGDGEDSVECESCEEAYEDGYRDGLKDGKEESE